MITRTSDVKAHAACPRAWYYRAVVDVATASGQAAKKGTVAHAEVERWLQYGAAATTKAGSLLIQGLQRLAEWPGLGQLLAPGAAAKAGWPGECEWHWTTELTTRLGVVQYHGTADLVLWEVDAEGGPLVPVIIDHKTRGNMDWAPTAEQLVEDWQAAAYVMAVIRKTGARVVYFIHNNVCERDRLVRPVAVRLEAHQVAAVWRQVQAHIDEMLPHAAAATAEDVPGDVSGQACGQYGGCPYQHRCTLFTRIINAGRAPAVETPMALIGSPRPSAAAAPAAPVPSSADVVASMAGQMAAVLPPPAPTATEVVARVDPATGEVFAAGGYHLYVNCYPLPRRGVQLDLWSLDEALAPMTAEVCKRRGVDHYSQVKFNEGRNDVMALLAVNLPPAGAHVLLDTSDELQRMALDVLLGPAATVIRGTK